MARMARMVKKTKKACKKPGGLPPRCTAEEKRIIRHKHFVLEQSPTQIAQDNGRDLSVVCRQLKACRARAAAKGGRDWPWMVRWMA